MNDTRAGSELPSHATRVGRAVGAVVLICVVIGATMLGTVRSAVAEVPNLDRTQLRRAASEIVVGTVERIDERTEETGGFRRTTLTHVVRVERVDQGDLALLGESIHATAWTRVWVGRGDPPAAAYGHRRLPKAGDRAVFHLKSGEEEREFSIVLPNGATVTPPPTAEEIEFAGDGGIELAGTILLPADATEAHRVPAALLLPGSGPTDRDGNQLPMVRTNTLRTIAEALADHGVATLRFDKRAHSRYTASWPKEPDALAEFFALKRFVDDAAAALRRLGEDPRVDADRLLVIGHSEGGLIALSLGARPEAALRGLGLLATAGRTLDIVLREQIVRSLDEAGAAPSLRTPIMESLEEIIVAVRERGEYPETIHPMLRALFNPSTRRIMYDYITIDPLILARSAPGSVLVLNGSDDIQISAERDAPRLAEALREREERTTRLAILNGVGHGLKPVALSDPANFSGPVAPAAIMILIDWANEATRE